MMRTGNDRLAHGTPLAGKVALVTGGAGGLGSATCEMLAQCGASVVAADIRGDAASTFAHVHTGIAATAADLTSEESMQSAFGFVIERFGRLDILINNAGTAYWTSTCGRRSCFRGWHLPTCVNLVAARL